MWAAGQRLGSYELVANLRSGGMATLFLAKRLGAAGFAKTVAIKVVHPELAGDVQFRQMFLDEALLSSRIQHPNVVHVEELGEHKGAHYLVMEFVHGCSLAQLARALRERRRRLSPAFAARIAMHVAEALHAAHETRDARGRLLDVVHRDVSPENILLSYSGHVKLIDFGIAKAYGRRHRTRDGLLKGKFRYMAPEQALAQSVDRRTDVYQLGIVLWEMLTQRKLFDAESDVALLAQVRAPRIDRPGKLVDRVPPALDEVVMMALATDPAKRHAHARAFARALAAALPAAHEVDAGALSALLLATMQEHRARQRGSYPEELYQSLEQQLDTQRLGGRDGDSSAESVVQRCTVETQPYARASARPEADAAAETTARERAAAPVATASHSLRAIAQAVRPRRLVRLASELRTTITAVENELRGRLGAWFALAAALLLSFVLALLTVGLREPAQSPSAGVVPKPPSLPKLVRSAEGARRAATVSASLLGSRPPTMHALAPREAHADAAALGPEGRPDVQVRPKPSPADVDTAARIGGPDL